MTSYQHEPLRPAIWTKGFTINFTVNFLVYLCMYLLIVVVAGYAKSEYHASDSIAGLVTGLFIVGSLIGRFITGRFIHRFGSKNVLLTGLVLLIASQTLYYFAHTLNVLMLTRLINGIATAVATTATGAIAAMLSPASRKSEGISFFSLSLVLGTAIGPFVALLLYRHFSMDVLFAICSVLGIISLLIALPIRIQPQTITQTKTAKSTSELSTAHRPLLSKFIAKEALPIALVVVAVGIGYASILTFLQFFADARHLVDAASYFFIFYALTSLVTRPISGRLMDSKNENIVVYPAFIFFILTFVCLYFAHSGIVLLLAGALLGVGYGNLTSVMQAIAIKVSTPEKYGVATSTFFIGMDFGIGFGPYVLGFFTHALTYAQLYGIMAIVMIIAMFLYYCLHGRNVSSIT